MEKFGTSSSVYGKFPKLHAIWVFIVPNVVAITQISTLKYRSTQNKAMITCYKMYDKS